MPVRTVAVSALAVLLTPLLAAPAQAATKVSVERISVKANGKQFARGGSGGALSADGKYVAFLTPNEDSSPAKHRIYVRNVRTGRVVSACTTASGEPASAACDSPSLSRHGRYLTFASKASNLVPGDTNKKVDVFRKDLKTGTVIRVSVTGDGTESRQHSFAPTMSADATRIAFASQGILDPAHPPAIDPYNGGKQIGIQQVYVKDLRTNTVTLASHDPAGNTGDDMSEDAKISADGTHLAFRSRAADLTGDAPRYYAGQTFILDLATGKLRALEKLLALELPDYNFAYGYSAPSDQGALIAFSVGIDTLEDDDLRPKNRSGLFVADLTTGKIVHTVRTRNGKVARVVGGAILSPDGRYLVFAGAGAFVKGDPELVGSLFLQNVRTGKIRALAAENKHGLFNNSSDPTSMSADGRTVAFDSRSKHLTKAKNTNGISTDAYLARVR